VDLITALYQKLDPLQPLSADDTQLYVDWQRELFGSDDIKLQLARGFARSVPGVPVTRLFTGHRGTGKTTELNRVKQMLERTSGGGAAGRKIFVSFLECEKWVDLNNLEPPDLILQMVRQLVLDLERAGYENAWSKVRAFFSEVAEVLNADVELKDLRLKADPFEIGVAIKQVPGARAKLRKHLEDRLPRIYDLVNSEILQPARKWLAGEGCEDVLIIVDQLDRIPQKQLSDRGLTNHEQLFLNSADVLRALQCDVLYTIPIELAYSHCHGRLADVYGGAILTLPMITVSGAAGEPGIERMIKIVRRRAEAAGVPTMKGLCTKDDLQRLCLLSGGHPRSLFILLRSAIDRSEGLPLETPAIDRAIRQQASEFGKTLSDEQWTALKQVHDTGKPLNADPASWMTFLRERYVYPYYDPKSEGLWYDWNPLLGEGNRT
jgi:hypothetical protein